MEIWINIRLWRKILVLEGCLETLSIPFKLNPRLRPLLNHFLCRDVIEIGRKWCIQNSKTFYYFVLYSQIFIYMNSNGRLLDNRTSKNIKIMLKSHIWQNTKQNQKKYMKKSEMKIVSLKALLSESRGMDYI